MPHGQEMSLACGPSLKENEANFAQESHTFKSHRLYSLTRPVTGCVTAQPQLRRDFPSGLRSPSAPHPAQNELCVHTRGHVAGGGWVEGRERRCVWDLCQASAMGIKAESALGETRLPVPALA